MNSHDEAVRADAAAEQEKLKKDPAWKDAFVAKNDERRMPDLKENLFETAKETNEALAPKKGQPIEMVPADVGLMSRNIDEVLKEADKAKIGKDPELQAKRDAFERSVALEILKDGFKVDITLAHTVWRIVAPLVGKAGRARDLAREVALAGKANVATYYALAKHDSTWVLSHGEDMARAAPGQVKSLLNSFSQLPSNIRIGELVERVQKAAG